MDQTHCTSFMTKYQVEQLLTIPSKAEATLPAEMFGVTDFWLETWVIIKISTQETLNDFNGG